MHKDNITESVCIVNNPTISMIIMIDMIIMTIVLEMLLKYTPYKKMNEVCNLLHKNSVLSSKKHS